QFVRFVALREADLSCAENLQSRRRRDRKASMRAVYPAGSLNDERSQNPRLAQHFQGDTRAHDIDDGIHRADFMEVHAVWRQTVNLPLSDGNAVEHRD